jgi:hypothetical protein
MTVARGRSGAWGLAVLLLGACATACGGGRPAPPGYAPPPDALAFTTVTQARPAGGEASGTFVIEDQAAYLAYFGGAPPASPTVDFASETVLAVRGEVGNQNYQLVILGIEPAAGGASASVVYGSVQVRTGIVAQVTVPSQHVVKLARGPASYSFRTFP